jgi:hypothetical protein
VTAPTRGCSSAGRAPALQAGGHRFDPGQLHQTGAAVKPTTNAFLLASRAAEVVRVSNADRGSGSFFDNRG